MKIYELLENNELNAVMDNQNWPAELQAEMYDEWVAKDPDGIGFVQSLTLLNNTPQIISTKQLLLNKENLDVVSRTPQEVIDVINKKWGSNISIGNQYEQNPERYFKYAGLSADTAKPSIIIDGEVSMGIGRFIAALLRGDKKIKAWILKRR